MSGYRKCCVCERISTADQNDLNARFFQLPKTPPRRKEWIRRLKLHNTELSSTSKVCDVHFPHHQLATYRLKRKALPFDDEENLTTKRYSKKHPSEAVKKGVTGEGLPSSYPCAISNSNVFKRQPLKDLSNRNVNNLTPIKPRPTQNTTPLILHLPSPNSLTPPTTIKCATPTTPTTSRHQIMKNKLAANRKQIKRLQCRNRISKAATTLFQCFEKMKLVNPTLHHWLRGMIQRIGNGRSKSRYDIIERAVGLSLMYSCGRGGYRTLLKLGMKLPSSSTLSKWISGTNLTPGIKPSTLEMLNCHITNLKEEDKDCVLMWDEMAIKEFLEYNKYTDCIDGIEDFGDHQRTLLPAKEALVFMISGIRKTWSFPVSFYFSHGNTESDRLLNLLNDNVKAIQNMGYRIRIGICDMSFTNQGLYRRMCITETEPFKVFGSNKIYFIHDTPHLIKLIRNNLMTKCIRFRSSSQSKDFSVAKWKHISDFYKFDCKRMSRMAPKLSKVHLNVKDFSKMKVRYATQVLSHSVSAGIRTMVALKMLPMDALQTAEFIKTFDEIFDLCNISDDNNFAKRERSGRYVVSNPDVFEKYICFLRTLSVSKNATVPDCFRGFLISLSGIRQLIVDLKSENYSYVMTRKLQQDGLENLFSIIRMRGGWNRNPTVRQFRQNIRFCFIKRFLKQSCESNCQDLFEEGVNFNLESLKKLLMSNKKEMDCDESLQGIINHEKTLSCPYIATDCVGSNSADLLSISKRYPDDCKNDAASTNVALYVAGYCVKSIVSRYKCQSCRSVLNERINDEEAHILCKNKAYNEIRERKSEGLQYEYSNVVNKQAQLVFNMLNSDFQDCFTKCLNDEGANIASNMFKLMSSTLVIKNWISLNCKFHREQMIKLFIRCKLFRLIKDQNDKWVQSKSWKQSRKDLRNQ